MLLFALVLLVVGGVIAYVGDRLGTYIGKKRLSAWGLRPRHTAMLYTVLSGGLISVLTLFALIGYDHTVQVALLRGPELLEQNQRLKSQNLEQGDLIRSREAQIRSADARAASAMTRTGQAEAQTRQALARDRTALQKALDAEGRLDRSLARLSVAQAGLAQSQGTLHRRQAQLSAAQRRLAVVNGSLGSTRSALRSAQRAVRDANGNVRLALRQYDHALVTVADLSRQGKQLSLRNADLTAQNTALDVKNQQLLTQTTFLQGAHLVYHRGQEVGRRVIPASPAADTVRQNLLLFLQDLSHTAEGEGAGGGDGARAVRVVADTADGKPVTEDQALDALAQKITDQSGAGLGVVVVATAHYNSFGGEPVQIEFQPFDNVLVFPRSALIASTVIDGSLPEDQILASLGAFLKERVQTAARRQGIIPRPDPETGEPTVGERTDSTKTLALVKQIQRIGPGALVIARAAADAYSSGPLRLDLTASAPPPVMPAPPPPPAHRPSLMPPPPAGRRGVS